MSADRYLLLQQRLDRLRETFEGQGTGGTAAVARLQQWFQQELLDAPIDANAQSMLVEIHKQLRLLATDAAFLQSARQPQTQQQRQQQVSDRLDRLDRYCRTLTEPNAEPDASDASATEGSA